MKPAITAKYSYKVNKYGWKPDLPDQRDHLLSLDMPADVASLPKSIDLRPGCPPVFDQLELGACTGNALEGNVGFIWPGFAGSRLFIYYGERAIEGTIKQDAGAMIRDGIKVLAKVGVCLESTWPYNVAAFAKKPPDAAYKEARGYRITEYQRLPRNLVSMKTCLAAWYPFVFGFSVYESFESDSVAKTGVMPMPAKSESMLGGHAVTAVGYDDAKQMMLVRNSWGANWGQNGYFWMPYAYFTTSGLSDDFWTIRK